MSKAFSPFSAAHELAKLGFFVVQIDVPGTSYRSKKFHDVCWQNLGDPGMPDWVRRLRPARCRWPTP